MRLCNWMWTLLVATAMTAVGCITPGYNLPPAPRLAAPGPGVTGPGPGVLASAATMECPPEMPAVGQSAQVLFAEPDGMQIQWDVSGTGQFDSVPLVVPGKYNFQQASIYRLKLTNVPIPGNEGVELYPTLEIGPTTPRTLAFLAHNAIPVQLTGEDFNQVLTGNYVTKVIYLPDPEFQEPAVGGVETLVSTRLDPGDDPIVEADRRGAILAVVRIGNKDMEMPGVNMEESFGVPGQVTSDGVAHAGYAGTVGMSPGYVAGVNSPQFGMPITGTPIGLPGPPHIPLGIPAGLQKHTIRNHTATYIPDPTEQVKIHVKQYPRVSYPTPANTAWIHQYNHPTCGPCVGTQY